MGFGTALGCHNDPIGTPKLRKRVPKGNLGCPSGSLLSSKSQCRNLAKTLLFTAVSIENEAWDHNAAARNSKLVQMLSKTVNSDDSSALFASRSEFKGDHRAPKGPQRAPKVASKWREIPPNCILVPSAVTKDLRGYPHGP